MNTLTIPVRQPEVLHDMQPGVAAWREDVQRRLSQEHARAGLDREGQMDVRRRVAGLRRAETAVSACLARQGRTTTPVATAPRAVVFHRDSWMRARLCALLQDRGVTVVGGGDDGAEALAMVLVEQPDLLVMEGRLPWVPPVEVLQDVRRFAPATHVAVQVEDPRAGDELRAAGAHQVFLRTAPLSEVCEGVAAAWAARPTGEIGQSA